MVSVIKRRLFCTALASFVSYQADLCSVAFAGSGETKTATTSQANAHYKKWAEMVDCANSFVARGYYQDARWIEKSTQLSVPDLFLLLFRETRVGSQGEDKNIVQYEHGRFWEDCARYANIAAQDLRGYDKNWAERVRIIAACVQFQDGAIVQNHARYKAMHKGRRDMPATLDAAVSVMKAEPRLAMYFSARSNGEAAESLAARDLYHLTAGELWHLSHAWGEHLAGAILSSKPQTLMTRVSGRNATLIHKALSMRGFSKPDQLTVGAYIKVFRQQYKNDIDQARAALEQSCAGAVALFKAAPQPKRPGTEGLVSKAQDHHVQKAVQQVLADQSLVKSPFQGGLRHARP